MAETFSPNVCLIDITMPGMNGNELAEKLRQNAREGSLLLIAVTAMHRDAGGDWAASFDLHLFKPVPTESLLAAIVSTSRRKFTSRVHSSSIKISVELNQLSSISKI